MRILAQVKPYKWWVAGFLGFVGGVSTLDSIFTYLTKQIIDVGIIPGDRQALTDHIILFGVLYLLIAVMVFGFIYLAGVLGERVRYDMRKQLFNHLQALSFDYFDRTPVGWIMSRVTSDTERIADLVTWGMLDVTWALMNIATATIFMMTINWQLALIVFLIIPVLIVIASWFQKRIIVEYREVRKTNSKITGAYNENIQGVRVSKALGREEKNLSEFSVLTDTMYRRSFRAAWLSALFLPVVQIVGSLGLGAIIWYGGIQVEAGGLTIGGIQAFIGYVTFMLWPIQDLARVYASMQQSVASAERVFSLVDAKPQIVDRRGAVDPGTIQGDIVFDNVDFSYEDDKPVIRGMNLTVKAGETIALVGPTGAGKSTLVNLVCRFYEPTGGRILFNGRDYTQLSLHAIQSRIGIVLQTPHLFSGSIRENIRYGRLDASDAEIEDAAKLAGAHDFIMTLANGYEEPVGEGGVLLSVGQKQLISLARAVLSQPELFIMDEATSSVDTLTEALIQRGMEQLMAGRTSFVIAHRLSTIRRADRILVIDGGRITEQGSHAELLRQRGHYYRLYTQQFRSQRELELEREMEPEPVM
ncbi:MAG: ABC transporter ATP-binding protein/permease [Anaerolineae bacterium]|nr:ABC transporter ATP-binding protein/permease [Anaerolineae bacterium]